MRTSQIAAGIGFLIMLLASASELSAQSASFRPDVPNFSFETLDGEKWSLSDHRGKVVLVNFWATWCLPCRKETPMLVRMSNEYKEAGLLVAGISLDSAGPDVVKKFLAEFEVNYPIMIAPADSPYRELQNLPMTLLVDGEGRLARKYTGLMPETLLREDINRLTAELKKENTRRSN